MQSQNAVVALFGELGVEVLDFSNENSVLQLSSAQKEINITVLWN